MSQAAQGGEASRVVTNAELLAYAVHEVQAVRRRREVEERGGPELGGEAVLLDAFDREVVGRVARKLPGLWEKHRVADDGGLMQDELVGEWMAGVKLKSFKYRGQLDIDQREGVAWSWWMKSEKWGGRELSSFPLNFVQRHWDPSTQQVVHVAQTRRVVLSISSLDTDLTALRGERLYDGGGPFTLTTVQLRAAMRGEWACVVDLKDMLCYVDYCHAYGLAPVVHADMVPTSSLSEAHQRAPPAFQQGPGLRRAADVRHPPAVPKPGTEPPSGQRWASKRPVRAVVDGGDGGGAAAAPGGPDAAASFAAPSGGWTRSAGVDAMGTIFGGARVDAVVDGGASGAARRPRPKAKAAKGRKDAAPSAWELREYELADAQGEEQFAGGQDEGQVDDVEMIESGYADTELTAADDDLEDVSVSVGFHQIAGGVVTYEAPDGTGRVTIPVPADAARVEGENKIKFNHRTPRYRVCKTFSPRPAPFVSTESTRYWTEVCAAYTAVPLSRRNLPYAPPPNPGVWHLKDVCLRLRRENGSNRYPDLLEAEFAHGTFRYIPSKEVSGA